MRWLEPLWAALSTYSVLPTPQPAWGDPRTRYAICWFPAVGVVCGIVLWGWNWICRAAGVGSVLFACGAVCLPLLLTGDIHLDGYMDTVDALASHQPREKKLAILKDSHCGAFAGIYCGIWFMLLFGLYVEIYTAGQVAALYPVFAFSRALSALCAITMPNARGSGMLATFTSSARTSAAVAATGLTAVLAGSGMVMLSPAAGTGAVAAGLISVAAYRRMAMRQFGGATGDTAGFFLQVCELSAAAGCWVGGLLA